MAVHLSHSLHLHADGLSASYGGRRVFTDLGFAVAPGQRLGLIGENGVGKSTLLRLIAPVDGRSDAASAALEDADVSGRLTRPVRTGLLRQELPFRPDQRLRDVIEAALAEVRAMERELDDAAVALADSGAPEAAAVAASAR
ncbi:ATP-binding cassette domain-containing protein, partial [Agromyces humi]|uniref:ATP-binding cassette domain-containing protein n=1 Tax=Agromyces humi TaxID=1766800 RepID=UPI00135AF58D